MSIEIHYELDPIYETIFLLYQGYDLEKFKNDFTNAINETGVNGEEFYQKNYITIDKYIRTFQKYRIPDDKDVFYFKDVSFDFYLSFIAPFFIDKRMINSIAQMNNDQILQIILQNGEVIFDQDLSEYLTMSHEEFAKTDFMMTFINRFDLSDNEKWKTLLILKNPLDYYRYFSEMIKKNVSAYEKAAAAVQSSLDKYMTKYTETFAADINEVTILKEFNLTKCEFHDITPSLITATGIIIIGEACYFGLITEKMLTEMGLNSDSKEYLITCLKALSDKSKLEILSTLKTSPKYAAELAAQLGLTSATVSHHMTTLMSAKLVYIEKSNGKFYYHINEDSINDIIKQLRDIL